MADTVEVLACPCGEVLRAATVDDLVKEATLHLAAEHPGLTYTRDQILFMSYTESTRRRNPETGIVERPSDDGSGDGGA
jgi:hypothetical protein